MTGKAFSRRSIDIASVPSTGIGDQRSMRRLAERTLSFLSPIFLLIGWEALVHLRILDARFFPAPSQVAGTFWSVLSTGELVMHIGISMQRSVLGFVIGAAPAILMGLSMGLFPLVRAAFWPLVGALYPIPKIAILPLVMLIFGLGESAKWAIIAIGVFFPVLINTVAGVLSIDQIYHDVAKNFGASRLNQYRTIALPGALPLVLTGIRIGWGTALLLIVAAEFLAAKSGLGWMIWQSWQTFAVERMYVGIITISALGYCSFLLLDGMSRLLVPWRPQTVH
jgi:ABC-type nitrate/sulfonate/bicarbonate transport system permease component